MLNTLDDEGVILERLGKGDHLAFARIYDFYWKPMLLIAWNHTKHQELAEDIVHEVFMKLWNTRETYKIDTLSGYLTTSIKYCVFNYYRKEKNRASIVSKMDFNVYQDDEAELDRHFLEEYIQDLLLEMPERSQFVFRQSREQGLKNSEIANLLNISEKSVEANLTRALKFIRKRMKSDGLMLLLSVDLIREYLG